MIDSIYIVGREILPVFSVVAAIDLFSVSLVIPVGQENAKF